MHIGARRLFVSPIRKAFRKKGRRRKARKGGRSQRGR